MSAVVAADQDPDRPPSASAPSGRVYWLARAGLLTERDWIIGSDEAGYGTWAGELIVAGVAVRPPWGDPDVTDSKALSDDARRKIVRRYRQAAEVLWVVERTSPQDIDRVGVWASVIRAHNRVHEALGNRLSAVDPGGARLHVADGLTNAGAKLNADILRLAKADQLVPAVSLASCFAKVVQCELMNRAAKLYPGYGFERHCGYGTPEHRLALAKLGVTEIHRKSYAPIRDLLTNGASPDRGG